MGRAAASGLIGQAVQQAVAHLAAGRAEEAEAKARQVLALQPREGAAWNVLGVLELRRRRWREAAQAFEKALTTLPADPYVHFNLGEARRGEGDLRHALRQYDRALAILPKFANAHAQRGQALRMLGRLEEASRSYVTAQRHEPGNATALNGIGLILEASGDAEAAARHFETAVGQNLTGEPSAIAALHMNVGLGRLSRGDAVAGFDALTTAISIQPAAAEPWRVLAEQLRHTRVVPETPAFRRILLALFDREDVSPAWLATAAAAALRQDAEVCHLLSGVRETEPAQLLAHPGLLRLLHEPLFGAFLTSTPVRDGDLELLLTVLRKRLLRAVLAPLSTDEFAALDLACALAQQCYLNEYVFFESPAETSALAGLGGDCRRAGVSDGADWLRLAVLGCYSPLHALGLPDLPRDGAPAPMRPLLRQQIDNPAKEGGIAAKLPRLRAASPSQAAPHSPGPHPRWVRAQRGTPRPWADVLRSTLPYLSPHEAGTVDTPKILVVDTRAGLQLVAAADRYAGAQVTGLEASLHNAAYAWRVLEELGVPAVRIVHGPWSGVAELEGGFDLVQAPSLMTRSTDPEADLKRVAAQLRPGGFAQLGFYSARGRDLVRRFHAWARNQDTESLTLSRVRQRLLLDPPEPDFESLTSPASDFWSTTACRELLFSSKEQRYRPTQISAMLDAAGLRFAGLVLSHVVDRTRFGSAYPSPEAFMDPRAWEAFEDAHSEVFGEQYRVWARKPLAPVGG